MLRLYFCFVDFPLGRHCCFLWVQWYSEWLRYLKNGHFAVVLGFLGQELFGDLSDSISQERHRLKLHQCGTADLKDQNWSMSCANFWYVGTGLLCPISSTAFEHLLQTQWCRSCVWNVLPKFLKIGIVIMFHSIVPFIAIGAVEHTVFDFKFLSKSHEEMMPSSTQRNVPMYPNWKPQ